MTHSTIMGRGEMSILHIIKKANDAYAWNTAMRQQQRNGDQVVVLLLHDAVFTPIQETTGVFACKDDVEVRRLKTRAGLVDYEEIVQMLFEANSVICW